MDKENQRQAVDSLREWSQWLIGIDFAAATGCVIILQGGLEGAPRLLLIAAIAAFGLSVLCAVLLVRVLAAVVEHLPLVDDSGEPASTASYRLASGITVGQLARLQLLLLVLGGICFLGWVILKPPG